MDALPEKNLIGFLGFMFDHPVLTGLHKHFIWKQK